MIVDEKGEIVDGDQFMAVIAECWHGRGGLRGGGARRHGHVAISASSAISPRSA